MRYLVLSDLHAGLEAFESCLRAAEGKFDAAVCLGDVVGYGPDPNAVIDLLLRQKNSVVIRGNHDKACCGIASADDFNLWAKAATYWTRSVLREEHIAFLRELPPGPKVLPGFEMVHGSERDEDEYVMNAPAAMPILQEQQLQLVFFGHTHYQGGFFRDRTGASRRIGAGDMNDAGRDGRVLSVHLEDETRYLINPGSVGQPRDGDWRAAFAIYDDADRRIDFYRASYDLPKTQEKMAYAGLPEPLIRRLEIGK
ncbi:MAG TPA: metallophosphoesterase family protein [Terriglobia bacterium]|nr:metallophosphoesterase family protein [Terriglobia bacterium]